MWCSSDSARSARHRFQRLLAVDPRAVTAWYNVGLLEINTHHEEDGWRGLGAALAGTDPVHAREAWQHAVELDPRDFDTLFNHGAPLSEICRTAEAVPHLKRFPAEAPRDRYAQDLPRVRALLTRAGHPS